MLRYKQQRNVINTSYQTRADNIVGKMTIQSLDAEMVAREGQHFRLLVAFGVADTAPKMAILAQNHPLPAAWAKQVNEAFKPNVVVVTSPARGTPEANVAAIKQAIAAANHGLVVFSVGHGIVVQGFEDQGGFDCADNKAMRLGGKGSFRDPVTFVDVFYDDKPPPGSTLKLSDRENDQKNKPTGSERRLKNWNTYLDLCKAFVSGKPAGVLLLTCNVGRATGFLKKVATQWQTPIIGYTQFTTYQGGFPKGRVRSIFDSDLNKQNAADAGSNTAFAEVMFPLSMTKMVQVRP